MKRRADILGITNTMSKQKYHDLPYKDPVSGSDLYVSELTSEESGVTIRGKFAVPRYSKLDKENAKFLDLFLRCRGMLNAMEKELGISYPTVRGRLENLLVALDITPIKDGGKPRDKSKEAEKRRKILDQLEKGEITAEEAKTKIRGGA